MKVSRKKVRELIEKNENNELQCNPTYHKGEHIEIESLRINKKEDKVYANIIFYRLIETKTFQIITAGYLKGQKEKYTKQYKLSTILQKNYLSKSNAKKNAYRLKETKAIIENLEKQIERKRNDAISEIRKLEWRIKEAKEAYRESKKGDSKKDRRI